MLFSKPTVPKTLDHWFNDIAAVTRLREILEEPAFQLACASLLSAAQPSFSSIIAGEGNNEKMCWLGGYSDFLRDLQKLTKLKSKSNNNTDEWSHIE
jgi:hypothetical protein